MRIILCILLFSGYAVGRDLDFSVFTSQPPKKVAEFKMPKIVGIEENPIETDEEERPARPEGEGWQWDVEGKYWWKYGVPTMAPITAVPTFMPRTYSPPPAYGFPMRAPMFRYGSNLNCGPSG